MSAALLLVAGLVVAGGGIAGLRRARRLARGARAQGTIAGSERHFTGKSGAYFPVLSFSTLDGTEMRTVVPQGRIFKAPRVGKQVKVLYDPANPADAFIDSPGLRYSGACFLILGLIFLALAIVQVL
jgi:hypothetical protein